MSISNYAENQLLDAVFNADPFSVANVYIQLHVGDPGEDGTANVAGNATRQGPLSFGAAAGGAVANDVAISWSNVSTEEDYTHFSLWDASSNGNCLWIGTVTANSVGVGDTFTIPIGDLDVTLD